MSDGWSKFGDAAANPADLFTGDIWAGKDRKKQQGSLQDIIDTMRGVNVPTLGKLSQEDYQYTGGYDPALMSNAGTLQYDPITAARMQAVNMGPSAMEGVSTDPRLRDAQQASLAALKGIADSGGATLQDKANLAAIQSQAAQADKGRRDAILANARARGVGGSGQEMMAQLASAQGAADQQAQSGLNVAAQAQQRALQAIMSGGNLAGDIRNQDFGEQARIAAAKDAVAQFNANQATGANRYNADAENRAREFNAGNAMRAGMYNIDNANRVGEYNANATTGAAKYAAAGRQDTANRNTGVHNSTSYYNTVNLPEAQYGLDRGHAADVAGAQSGMGSYWGQQAANQKEGWGNMASLGAASAAKGYDMYNRKDPNPMGSGGDQRNTASSYGSYDNAPMYAAHGGLVPGKARMPGDNAANDTVPAQLSPGEAVVPRSVMSKSPDQVAKFIAAIKRPPEAVTRSPVDDNGQLAGLEALLSKLKGGRK